VIPKQWKNTSTINRVIKLPLYTLEDRYIGRDGGNLSSYKSYSLASAVNIALRASEISFVRITREQECNDTGHAFHLMRFSLREGTSETLDRAGIALSVKLEGHGCTE